MANRGARAKSWFQVPRAHKLWNTRAMTNAISRLTPGDKAPNIEFRTQDRVTRNIYKEFCARPLALLVCHSWPQWPMPAAPSPLPLLIITATDAAFQEPDDPAYVITGRDDIVRELSPSGDPVLICLNANHMVLSTQLLTGPDQLARALEAVATESQPSVPGSALGTTAPALVVPAALEPSFCRELIHHHDTQGAEASGVYKMIDGESVYVPDEGTKVRTECKIEAGELLQRLESRMQRRVLPEIFKCFQFQVTRYEGFKVVCYDAQAGGHFVAHRDNDGPDTAHRRFALTINLNSEDYRGGGLRFPEYSADHFAPASGDAIVFSCSMAHEVLRLTEGRRYALISFFYGDNDQLRRAEFAR